MNIKKDDGYTPLHLAALNDHLDVVTALADLVSPFGLISFPVHMYIQII